MDEFQTYISAGLADGLAEVRKYGLNMVLANQSLSQLQGDRYQTEVAEAVMSNAANVIAFRVGIADAARLGRRFEPELPAAIPRQAAELPCRRHCRAGLSVSTPEVFATLPEPKPPRRKAASQRLATYSRVPARIVRLIGERSAAMRCELTVASITGPQGRTDRSSGFRCREGSAPARPCGRCGSSRPPRARACGA